MVHWSNNFVGLDITNLPAGNYSATVSDGGCSQVISQIQIVQPDSIYVAVNNITSVSCANGNTGAVDIFVTGGTGSYAYQWSNAAITQDITGLVANTYTVLVSDSLGCSKYKSFSVAQPTGLQVMVDSLFSPSCNGDSTGYVRVKFAGGVTPYQYHWENQQTSATRTKLPAGQYTLTLTDANQCTASFMQTISEPDVLTVEAGALQNPTCIGVNNGNIILDVNGGTNPYTAHWSSSNSQNTALSGLGSGQYAVTVTDGHQCTQTLGGLNMVAPQAIQVAPAQVKNVSCFGQPTGEIYLVVNHPNPVTIKLNNQTAAANNINLAAGDYAISVQNALGCVYRDTVEITQPAQALTALISSVEQPLCAASNSGAVIVSTSGGTTPYHFDWNTGQTTESIQNLGPNTYALSVTDSLGCNTLASPVSIFEPSQIVATITKQDIPCFGTQSGSINLQVSGGVPGYKYLWTTGDTTSAIYFLPSGQYGVTITDLNGCTLELKTIELLDLRQDFAVTVDKTQNLICHNQQNGQIVVHVNPTAGPYAFNWSQPVGLRMRNVPNDTAQNLMAGSYRVTVTNGDGCVAISPDLVIFNPPQLEVNQSVNNILCKGDSSGQVEMIVNGGVPPYQFLWSDMGPSVPVRADLPAGAYSVIVKDFNQCQMLIGPFEIQEPTVGIQVALDSLNGGLMHDNCSNCSGRIQIKVDGGQPGYSYKWNDNATDQDRMNLCAGNYAITVTDLSGCKSSLGPLTILALNDAPGLDTVRITDIPCKGDSTGIIRTSTSGGTPPYTLYWSNNMIGDTLTNIPAGLYITTITDINQCTSTFGVIVNEPDSALSVSHIYTSPSWGATNGNILLTISGGTPGYHVTWSANAHGQEGVQISSLSAGVYIATITDDEGCSFTYMIDITSSNEDLASPFGDVRIAPNPVDAQFEVMLLSPTSIPVRYQIMDGTGRIVQEDKFSMTIQVDRLSKGFYVLALLDEDGQKAYIRWVKQ